MATGSGSCSCRRIAPAASRTAQVDVWPAIRARLRPATGPLLGRSDPDDLVRLIVRKRYRKSPCSPAMLERIDRVVRRAIADAAPVHLLVPVGGYKSPASPESPYLGWAEIFALWGMVSWLALVARRFPPGLHVEFSSDGPIAPLLTGAPGGHVDAYARDFGQLLRDYRGHPVGGIAVTWSDLRQDYDVPALHSGVLAESVGVRARWARDARAGWGPAVRAAARNSFDPQRDPWHAASLHEAFIAIDLRERHHRFHGRHTIPVSLRRGLSDWLHIGAVHSSATQFWIGWGALDATRTECSPRIFPPSAYQSSTRWLSHIPARHPLRPSLTLPLPLVTARQSGVHIVRSGRKGKP
jgi:hypothetical protein